MVPRPEPRQHSRVCVREVDSYLWTPLTHRMVPALLMLMMATATPAATGSNRRKPHIIFILADDMGWADASFHGSPPDPDAQPGRPGRRRGGAQQPLRAVRVLAVQGRLAHGAVSAPLRLGWESVLSIGAWRNPSERESAAEASRKAWVQEPHRGQVAYWIFDVESHANEPRLRQPRRLSQPRRGLRHTHGHLQRIVRLRLLVQRAAADRCLRCLLHGHLLEQGENHHQGSRRLRATLDTMDQATGAVVEALYEKGMLEDAVIIFSSDNGPDPIGMGSSWPLRGSKQSLWEGGVRVPAFIWSPLLDRSGAEGRVSWDLMHMVDWMPTLYQAAGGKIDDLGPIDGVSQWGTLSRGEPPARQELLHGFDPTDGSGAYRSGRSFSSCTALLPSNQTDRRTSTQSLSVLSSCATRPLSTSWLQMLVLAFGLPCRRPLLQLTRTSKSLLQTSVSLVFVLGSHRSLACSGQPASGDRWH
ncbi:arylsulfatase B-like isoform X3 [Amblyomma americanum]